MGLVDSLIEGAKTAEDTGVMDQAVDYGAARDWLSTILPGGKTFSGETSDIPSWAQDNSWGGPGQATTVKESMRAPGYAEQGTEFMSRDRLEAWGVPYDQPISKGSNLKGSDILYRGGPTRDGIGQNPYVDSSQLSSDKDIASGWDTEYFGEGFRNAQYAVYDQVKGIHEKNPESWIQSDMPGSKGGWNLSDAQIDEIGATYKNWMDKDSPGYKVASEKFGWKD